MLAGVTVPSAFSVDIDAEPFRTGAATTGSGRAEGSDSPAAAGAPVACGSAAGRLVQYHTPAASGDARPTTAAGPGPHAGERWGAVLFPQLRAVTTSTGASLGGIEVEVSRIR